MHILLFVVFHSLTFSNVSRKRSKTKGKKEEAVVVSVMVGCHSSHVMGFGWCQWFVTNYYYYFIQPFNIWTGKSKYWIHIELMAIFKRFYHFDLMALCGFKFRFICWFINILLRRHAWNGPCELEFPVCIIVDECRLYH